MKSVLVLWAARWRGLSQKQLRRLLLGSMAVHLGIAVYVLAALPIVPIRPICRDGSIDIDTPRLAIEGSLAEAYFDAFERRFAPHMIRYANGNRWLYVTLAQSLDWSEIEKQSDLAVKDVLQARLDNEAYRDLNARRTAIPGLYEGAYPDCVTMRKFATAGGEWSKRGPQPVPVK
jgi:hypothetical protein